MEGPEVVGTRGKNVNVLQNLTGHLKNHLSSEDKAYQRYKGTPGLIEDYPQGLVPLVVPLM